LKWCTNNLLLENFSSSNHTRKKDFISLHLEWNGLVVKIFLSPHWIWIQPPWCEAKGKMLKTKDGGKGGQR
jgi:hypothetical protein